MPRLRDLILPIKADPEGLKQGLGEAEDEIVRFSRGAKIGFAAAGAALVAATQQAIEYGTEIAQLSERIGLAAEEFQVLARSAAQFGVEGDDIVGLLGRTRESIAEAQIGTASYVEDLERLNLRYQDLINLAPDRQLEAVSRALLTVTNETERYGIALRFMGGDAERAYAFIEQLGTEGLGGIRENVGYIASDEAIEAVRQLSATLAEGASSFKNILIEALGQGIELARRIRGNRDELYAAYYERRARERGIYTDPYADAPIPGAAGGAATPPSLYEFLGAGPAGPRAPIEPISFTGVRRQDRFGPPSSLARPSPAFDQALLAIGDGFFPPEAETGLSEIGQRFRGALTNSLITVIASGNYDSIGEALQSALVATFVSNITDKLFETEFVQGLFSFHSGGYVPGPPGREVPAVLEAGELVLTREQQRSFMGGVTVQMQVIGDLNDATRRALLESGGAIANIVDQRLQVLGVA